MNAARAVRWLTVPAVALTLLLIATGLAQSTGLAVSTPPLPEAQGQSFAVKLGGTLAATGVTGADILGAGGMVLIPCGTLGLVCTDPASGAKDEFGGLSFGEDFSPSDLPPVQFSVSSGGQGLPGTAVYAESHCAVPEPQADVFGTAPDGSNAQVLDGNGLACASGAGLGLGLNESAGGEDLVAIEEDPCHTVDANCDGMPEGMIFFTLAPGSLSLDFYGVTPRDILVSLGGMPVVVWATGSADLGLRAGDVIDALCVRENGDALLSLGDRLLISLAQGSPTLAALNAGSGDLLKVNPPRALFTAAVFGLERSDDVDALRCNFELKNRYLARIQR